MSFTPDNIKERMRRQPFTPLQLVTSTGKTYDIYHPDMVFVTSRYLMVGLPSKRNPSLADDATYIALMHVTELRELEVPAKPSNGDA